MRSRKVLTLFCRVEVLQKKKKTKKNKHKIWEGSLVENSLRKLTSYSQGCMEIILKWRDIFGVYVKGQS